MLSDETLVGMVLKGELQAFEELVNRYKQSVFSITFRMISNQQEAEDIAQDVFITVYQKLYQFDRSKKFSPWIHRIAVNTCINEQRRKKKIISLAFDESYMDDNYDAKPRIYGNPELIIEREEFKKEVNAALDELNDGYKMVLVLRYQMELSTQEIAEIMGISRENTDVKIHRARKALRKIIIKGWEERGKYGELLGNY